MRIPVLIILMLAAVATCARASQDPATNHEDELDMEMDEDDEDRAGAKSNSTLTMEESRSRFDNSSITAEGEDGEKPEALPEALELRYSRPKLYSTNGRRRPTFFNPPSRRTPVPNRRNVYHHDKPSRSSSSRPPRRPLDPKRAPTESECTFFSKTVCLEAADYPMEAIMRSIRNNKEMVTALLADFKVQESGFYDEDDPPSASYKDTYDQSTHRYKKNKSKGSGIYDHRFETSNEIKRKFEFNNPYENLEEGYTCQSQVRYARPQLARAASGVWKYIINTGEHTQTLRLEKCGAPKSSCSFISENYRSSCMQVYNYHRLLTWDSKLGLHMDIFKVPTCCSCHVHGYTDLYPPHQTDPPLKAPETFPGADFAQSDHQGPVKYSNSLDTSALNLFRDNYGPEPEEHQLEHSSSARRPSVVRPPSSHGGGGRPRKPSNPPKPFAKLPQQHAPNTRAPGYKGQAHRPYRPSRPFRRESAASDVSDYSENSSNITLNRFGSQTLEQPENRESSVVPSVRLQNGGFDDEPQDPSKPINYNYHYIIDFFKPEAAMLKSEPLVLQHQHQTSSLDHDSWKPIVKP